MDDESICFVLSHYFVLLPQKRWFQFNSRIVRTHFASAMTLNNCDIIEETRSYILLQMTFSLPSRSFLLKLPIITKKPKNAIKRIKYINYVDIHGVVHLSLVETLFAFLLEFGKL